MTHPFAKTQRTPAQQQAYEEARAKAAGQPSFSGTRRAEQYEALVSDEPDTIGFKVHVPSVYDEFLILTPIDGK